MVTRLAAQLSPPTHQLYVGIEQLDVVRVQEAIERGALGIEKPAQAPGEPMELVFSCLLNVTTWNRQDCLNVMAIERLLLAQPQAPVAHDLWQGQPLMVGVTQDLFRQIRSGDTSVDEETQRLERWLQHPFFAQRGAEWGEACVQRWLDQMDDEIYADHPATWMLARNMVTQWMVHGVDLTRLKELSHEDPRRAIVDPLFQAWDRHQQSVFLSPSRHRRRRSS